MEVRDFLKYSPVYDQNLENCIQQEFLRLSDNCYLDHVGAALYSERQMKETFEDFSQNLYGNPHANNLPSKSTEDAIDIIRYQVLEHFHTNNEEYSLIFTSSATSSLKIIAECFFHEENRDGVLAYLEDNHTSVLGMRNYASNSMEIKTEQASDLLLRQTECSSEKTSNGNGLFVYPAQSNFSGTIFPFDWIECAQKNVLNNLSNPKCKRWYVVLDCASYLSTNQLDLSVYKPDFVPISFYKLFGFPSGLGALIVKKSSETTLKKKYFGGGTVQMALSSHNVMIPRVVLHERFEDGTLPFLSILAVKHGFNTLRRLNLNHDLISKHTFSLAQFVYRNLLTLHHSNGQPVAVFYHDTTFENGNNQGGTVNFNLLRPNGEFVGYSEVLHMANLAGIHLRTGCFCNPGACHRFLKLQADDVFKQFKAGHTCGDQHDLVDGYPTGSVRISFGYMSSLKDAQKCLQMIENCFVEQPVVKKIPDNWEAFSKHHNSKFLKINRPTHKLKDSAGNAPANIVNEYNSTKNLTKFSGLLETIFLYPIKSCGAFSVQNSWKLTNKGLKYDREWMIINSSGICITQKHNKRLSLIKPYINLDANTMKLEFKGQSGIEITLDISSVEKTADICQSKICGDKVQGWDCGDEVADWLERCLDTPGLRLLRQFDDKFNEESLRQLSFVNKGQYLLINSASVEWLIDKIQNESFTENLNSVAQRFRPNFIVNLGEPFQEEKIDEYSFGDLSFQCTGKCTRCQMICINQETGKATKEPLLTLSKELKGKISFGVYLSHIGNVEDCTISIRNKTV